MVNLEQIIEPINSDLNKFKDSYKSALRGGNSKELDFISYLIKSEGKGIRPVLLFLVARMHGTVTEKSYLSAAIMELTHTASLVHDDIVDEAFQRRGRWSINALWRSQKAVLIGDYIFSRAISTATSNSLVDVLGDIASVIEDMSLGEIEQSDASIRLDMNEQTYFEVIRRKTASLMSCSARLGVKSVDGDSDSCARMSELGEIIGIIFQIKDDILDYTGGDSGKIIGNDLKEQKITLPLIYALKKSEQSERNSILKLLRYKDNKRNYIERISEFVIEKGGIIAAQKRMQQYEEQAISLLEVYPDSVYKKSLINLIRYVCDRKK